MIVVRRSRGPRGADIATGGQAVAALRADKLGQGNAKRGLGLESVDMRMQRCMVKVGRGRRIKLLRGASVLRLVRCDAISQAC